MPRCGNCRELHGSAAEVKACYAGEAQQPSTQAVTTAQYGKGAGPKPATEKQVAFMRSLISENAGLVTVLFGPEQAQITEEAWQETAGDAAADRSMASGIIESLIAEKDRLKSLAKEQGATPTGAELEDGVYELNGVIFKLVHAVHGSGKQYAKRMDTNGDKPSWEYEGRGILRHLTPEHKLTAEKAKEFGLLYGMCINCSRTLTKEESIFVGYGPVCAANNAWYYPTKTELAELQAASS